MTKRQSTRSSKPAPVMIQVDISSNEDIQSELDDVRAKLKDAGFDISADYKPVRVGTKDSRRYVLRGLATEEAIGKVAKDDSVTIFPDLQITSS